MDIETISLNKIIVTQIYVLSSSILQLEKVPLTRKCAINNVSFLDVNDILAGLFSNKIFGDFVILGISRLDQRTQSIETSDVIVMS